MWLYILGDLWLPLSPWSLYNSNCVQICMSSACHFPRNNLLYARCDLGECDSHSKPFIIHPTHTVSHLSLYLHTSETLRQSDWQHVTAKHAFECVTALDSDRSVFWIWCVLKLMMSVLFHRQSQTHRGCLRTHTNVNCQMNLIWLLRNNYAYDDVVLIWCTNKVWWKLDQ